MTNIKRGLSQVARDVKHTDDKAKSKKKKSQSAQKVAATGQPKVKESHESRSKKSTQQKRKKSTSANQNSITIKKKDIEQHKNANSSGVSKTKVKRDVPNKEVKRKNEIVLKGSVRSNSTVRSKLRDDKGARNAVQKEKPKDGGIKNPKTQNQKLSKEKLDKYLAYIAAKLSRDRAQPEVKAPSVKSRPDTLFKPPDVFGTISYKTKPLQVPKKSSSASLKSVPKKPSVNSSAKRPPSHVNKSNIRPIPNKQRGSKQAKSSTSKTTAPKVAPTKPIVNNNKLDTLKTVSEAPTTPTIAAPGTAMSLTAKITTAQPATVKPAAPTPPSVFAALKYQPIHTAPGALKSAPPVVAKVPSPKRLTTKTEGGDTNLFVKSPARLSRENSLSRRSNSSERGSSKYKKMKYQTSEELLKFYKDRVEKAIRDKKTFTVCGNFWSVRKALLARGWVEKIHNTYAQPDRDQVKKLLNQSLNELIEGVTDSNNGALYKRVIMSKMLGRHQVDLFWDFGCDPYRANPDSVKLTMINHIRRGLCSYSSKEGLCEIMKKCHWFHFPGVSNIRHPRSYALTENGDPDEFVKDFRITAAMSMLKWIVASSENTTGKLISEAGKVPIKNFHFAMTECDKFLQNLKNEDIDNPVKPAPEFEWNSFLENYYRCVHIGNHFKSTDLETEQTVLHKSKIMLNRLRKSWSQVDMDGYMNIWILKPTAGSRGIGIHICRTLAYVLRVVSERKNIKYVIQKYIERPLLIYNTKFDIRQWFLISCTNPLTIWMYKMCYLRFSSQTYNLRKLHESIHLTNNSVQCKYKNSSRDPSLPEYNMWDSNRFKTYLESIGYPLAYDNIVYPGMKQCITAAVLVQQEYITTRKNCFELYGADFMLTEDFQPWLIEINSRPALYASTPITGRMCPQVLEDLIKVIVDYPHNVKANTGHFELMYREMQHNLPPVDVSTLAIRGVPLSPGYFLTPAASAAPGAAGNKLLAKISSVDFININNAQHYMTYVSKQLKQTLRTLLDIINKERERRKQLEMARWTSKATTARVPVTTATTGTSKGPATNPEALSDCMPYISAVATIKQDLDEITEIFVPKYLTNRNLDNLAVDLRIRNQSVSMANTSASFSQSTIKKDVVDAGAEVDLKAESVDKSEATSNGEDTTVEVGYDFLKEAETVISEHSERLEHAINQLPKNQNATKGFLAELSNYLTFWRVFAKNKCVKSSPESSKGGWSKKTESTVKAKVTEI